MGGAAKLTRKMSGKTLFKNKSIVAIALITLLALSMLAISTIPVKTQQPSPTLTSDRTRGFVFTEVTLEGTGWLPLATVKIYFNSTVKGIFDFIKDVTTNATGGFKTTVQVPPVPPGNYTWYAVIPATAYAARTANFTVLAGIGVTPQKGPVGSTVRIAGSADEWAGKKVVFIIFDKNRNGTLDAGEILKNVTATERGVIDTNVVIPDVKADTYYFYANITNVNIGDRLSDSTKYYNASFSVLSPELIINPSQGPVLSKVSVAGNYFKVNYKVNITLVQGSTIKAVLATNVPTNSTGGFNVTVTIPFCTKAGLVYTINATDGINSATQTFSVLSPTITTISPDSAKVGESITVEGKDFAVSSPVTIYFSIDRDGTYELIPVATVTTNATGGFKTTVKVPPVPSDYKATDIVKVNVTDNCNYDTKDFDVIPAITLSPVRAPTGFNVTVTGTGFRNETTVTIMLYSGSQKIADLAQATTDKYGSFKASFIVPEVPDGSYIVNATDKNGNNATAIFQVVAVELRTILDAVNEVEKKIDTILAQGISIDLTPVLNAIAGIDKKLGQFLGSDTVASLLYEIKASVSAINWADITAINAKLGVFSGSDTVASLLYDIRSKLEAITAGAQAASGSGATQFTSSRSVVIYSGTKVGTVTVSIKTSGVTYGERLVIRYYLDNTNYIEKVVTSSRDTAGWTDTAAAMKVELVYTWRSGTDTVYYAYSVIYPP